MAKLLSIIVPLYNEAENIPLMHRELETQAKKMSEYRFEFIFVDDGSRDESMSVLHRLAKADRRVRVLEFARNFGKEAAVSAGLHAAKGDAVAVMDADLQHPPQLLAQFIKKWRDGADVVVGVREYDAAEGWLKKLSSDIYYAIMGVIAHTKITPHATDYRLLDRSVVDAFNRMGEHNRMTRGLIDWLGFRRDYVHFHAPPRQNGERGYTYRKLINLAMNSFMSYSLMPLKFAGYMGIVILLVSGPLSVFVVIEKYILHDPFGLRITGTATLALMLLFLIGLVLIGQGLVALYIAHIHAEVTNRPLYVVRNELGDLLEDEA
ncbi:MAG TPA: glycosyltransferase family 2 protein [Candidatus Acidoferrum sp.]|nr:glycosyltransferase family 2 protein [Candidatus Acidoferrum sp.]